MLTLAQLSERYGTPLDAAAPGKSRGLSAAEAAARLAKYGKNRLSPPKATPEWVKFLLTFTNPFMIVLTVAGALCFLAWGVGDHSDSTNAILGGVLWIVVFLTCTMTYFQGRSTSAVMDTFAKMLPQQCTVVRDGGEARIPAEDLVPGDFVRLGLGDRVPADIRLVSVNDLKVEMSSLTGEPDAIALSVERQHDSNVESRAIAFNSALVMNGEGRGVVIRTGDNTFIGKIAGLASATTGDSMSSMEREVLHFVHQVTVIAICTSILFFIIGASRAPSREGIVAAFINGMIIVMVAFVPEGLPATVAACLSISAQRMAAKHVFIKRPDIIETLGAATVICSDKTGTLTQNRMTVENLWVNCHVQSATSAVSKHVHMDGPAVDPVAAMAAGRTLRVDAEGTVSAHREPPRALLDGDSALARAEQMYGSSFYGSFSSFKSLAGSAGAARASWAKSSPYMRLVIAAGVCNRARFAAAADDSPPAGDARAPGFRKEVKVLGDASDAALLRWVDKIMPIFELRSWAFPAVYEIPFNSVNKWSLAVIVDPMAAAAGAAAKKKAAASAAGAGAGAGTDKDPAAPPPPAAPHVHTHVSLMKGAPEIILARCVKYLKNGVERPIDDDFRAEQQAAYERFGFMGERVLGFAFRGFDGPKSADAFEADDKLAPRDGMTFLGLISLVDPPREGVAEAVGKCRAASIRVTMVTGDHPLTAEAIARKVGIITRPTAREVAAMDGVDEADIPLSDERVGAAVRAGHQLHAMTEADWDALLAKEEVVFARTTPTQKLAIVEHYQRLKHVVAVTGDGVNDSPALKKANIGVAMGSAEASDVAREAADIVLMDDNFASIVNAIEEGRCLFDNLKKSIAYTISHTIPELFPALLNLWFSFPLATPGLVILSVDLLTEQAPALSFAYEKAEAAVMRQPPRRMGVDRLVSRQVIFYAYVVSGLAASLACMFAYFMVYVRAGVSVSALYGSALSSWAAGSAPFPTAGGGALSDAQQVDVYQQSVSAYYSQIIACQALHLWMCKTRLVSIWTHGLSDNILSIVGCVVALIIACFFIYVPGVQPYFFTGNLDAPLWFCSLSYGAWIWTYNESVKAEARRNPAGWAARNLAW